MPQRVQNICWEYVLPAYKGTRSKSEWPFLIEKSVWRDYKEKFADELAVIYRGHVIGHDEAEGDDVIYVGLNHWQKKYDSIVLITRDSDLNQLKKIPKLMIFNHVKETFVKCDNPETFCECKILSGDKSDNINGVALPGKKIQVGEKGAIKLFESTGNIYSKAQDEGWDKQYIRNQKLIDLDYIPTHIQREIVESLDSSNTDICSIEQLYSMGYTDKIIDDIVKMKNVGYYSLNTKEYVESVPDLFKRDLVKEEVTKRHAEITNAATPKRNFDDFSDIFKVPVEGRIF